MSQYNEHILDDLTRMLDMIERYFDSLVTATKNQQVLANTYVGIYMYMYVTCTRCNIVREKLFTDRLRIETGKRKNSHFFPRCKNGFDRWN